METPAQMCARLVTALEDLAGQEAVALQARDFHAVIAVQDRAAPLIEHLAAHAADITDTAVRARLAAIQSRRAQTGEWLAEQISRTRDQLRAMEASTRRITQVAPVYGRATTGASKRLCAVG